MIAVCEISAHDISLAASMERKYFTDAWSEKALQASFERKQTIIFGAYEEKVLVGYLILYYVLDEGEIIRIAVEKNKRRNGIGRQLLFAVEEFCTQHNIAKLFLEVREHNASAIAFYKGLGFRQDGKRKKFYTNPAEDAILMSRELGR